MKVRPNHIRYGFFVLALITALPLSISILTGLLLWSSPFILFNSVLAVKSLVWLNLLGLGGLLLIIFKTKGICRYACPLGVVCDWSSRIRRQVDGYGKIRNLNKYLAVFAFMLALIGFPMLVVSDPFNLFHLSLDFMRTGIHTASLAKFTVLIAIILINVWKPNIWCKRICPLGGMQLLAVEVKRAFSRHESSFDQFWRANRRNFLTAAFGLGSGYVMHRFIKKSESLTIRPPGAVNEKVFNFVCARCGNCSSVCPTNIIHQSTDISNPDRLLTPLVNMTESYCLPDCTSCGEVCPSSALLKFTVESKKKLFMGTARIHLEHCLLQQFKECDLCRYHCSYDAVEIFRSGSDLVALPRVIVSSCVGCGACKIVCPANVIDIVPYTKSQELL